MDEPDPVLGEEPEQHSDVGSDDEKEEEAAGGEDGGAAREGPTEDD